MVRIGTPRRRLRGVLVFLLVALGCANAARAAEPSTGDCAILGTASPPFEAGDLVTVVEAKAGEVSAVWASSLSNCSKPTKISGWIPTNDFAKHSGPLHESPSGAIRGKLFPWQKVAVVEKHDGWTRISSLEGTVPVAAIRFLKLMSMRHSIPDLTITPGELRYGGKRYSAKAICGGHLFTEAASFFQTGDSRKPLAILCTGSYEGDKNYLTLFGTDSTSTTVSLDPGETATIGVAALVHALDRTLKKP